MGPVMTQEGEAAGGDSYLARVRHVVIRGAEVWEEPNPYVVSKTRITSPSICRKLLTCIAMEDLMYCS